MNLKGFDFLLLQTGFVGNDTPVFALTDRPLIFYKVLYVPPYDDLKRCLTGLQLKERAENPFQERVTLALDVTEWIGKENDEFFAVIVKYLADMLDRWNYILIANIQDAARLLPMRCLLQQYMRGKVLTDKIWKSPDTLEHYLISQRYTRSAASLLASILWRPDMGSYRTQAFIKTITDNIASVTGRKQITEKDLMLYVRDEDGVILMSLGKEEVMKYCVNTKEDDCA